MSRLFFLSSSSNERVNLLFVRLVGLVGFLGEGKRESDVDVTFVCLSTLPWIYISSVTRSVLFSFVSDFLAGKFFFLRFFFSYVETCR